MKSRIRNILLLAYMKALYYRVNYLHVESKQTFWLKMPSGARRLKNPRELSKEDVTDITGNHMS